MTSHTAQCKTDNTHSHCLKAHTRWSKSTFLYNKHKRFIFLKASLISINHQKKDCSLTSSCCPPWSQTTWVCLSWLMSLSSMSSHSIWSFAAGNPQSTLPLLTPDQMLRTALGLSTRYHTRWTVTTSRKSTTTNKARTGTKTKQSHMQRRKQIDVDIFIPAHVKAWQYFADSAMKGLQPEE